MEAIFPPFSVYSLSGELPECIAKCPTMDAVLDFIQTPGRPYDIWDRFNRNVNDYVYYLKSLELKQRAKAV